MKKNLLLLFLMVLPFFVSSCSDEDGEGTPMKWKTEVKKSSDDYFHVPPQGGTYVFYCTNYSSFWVVSATEKEAGGEEKRFSPNYDFIQIKADLSKMTKKHVLILFPFCVNIKC